MRTALYARVSSLRQSKEDRWSLPDQLEIMREFAQQAGETIVFETSEVHSGATLHRPKIEELFERALAGEYDTIIVHEQDRLSREPKDAAYLEVHARLHGIRLICLDTLPKDGTTLSETEEMKIELERLFAKWERHKIYFRTSERRKRRAKEGNLIPSSSPLYGYLWDNDQRGAKRAYVADPQTAPIVRRIFEEIAAGRSLKAIAKQLTLEKIPPPAAYHVSLGLYPASRAVGPSWRPTTIARMVHHPAYWGEHAAYRRATYKTETRTSTGRVRDQIHSRTRKTPEEGLIPLPQGACPALVSKELAQTVHTQLARNKSQAAKGGKSASLALLRGGIAVCGYCGDKMYCAAHSAPYAPRYYCRRSRLKQHGSQPYCEGGNFSIQHDLLDAQIWAIVVDALTNPTALAEALAQHEAEATNNQEKSQKRLRSLRTLVTQKEGERERLVLTHAEQEDEDTRRLISGRLKILAGEIKQLKADIEAEQRLYEEPAEQRNAIRKLVTWGAKKKEDLQEASLEEKRNILLWLRAQVKVWRANHQPRFEVRLFGRPDGGGNPMLIGGGNGRGGGNGGGGGIGKNTDSSTWFDGNAKALAHIPNVEAQSSEASLPPTNTDHIVLVSQDVAAYKGQQVLGQNGQNLGSTYHLEEDEYALQSINRHLYWVAPLVYNNLFTNLNNSDTPGYVVIDAEDPDTQPQLRTGAQYQLHYIPGAIFNQDLLRHVYLSGYTNGNLVDPTLEVRDDWKPFFTISLMQPSRGFTGDALAKVLLVDPQSGNIQSFDPQDVPSWIDRVIPSSTVTQYLTWWGQYENAPWFNPSGSGQQAPSGDPELVYNDVDQPVWLVPMTSASSNDNSSTGVFLFSTHENKAQFYPLRGLAVGASVENAFQGNPHNIRQYSVSSIQLYQIYGEPTWVAIFVQASNIGATFQAIGLLDAKDPNGADVQMETSRSTVLADYQQWLTSHASTTGGPSQNGQTKQLQGAVKRISPVTQGSNTIYYIWVEGENHIFTANLTLSPKLPLVQPGDTVTGTYLDTGETVVPLQSFDDTSIQLGPGTTTPTPTPTATP